MSLKTWMKEFYPILAYRCSKKQALEHSLRKWEGALKKNLKKHCVRYALWSIEEPDAGLYFESLRFISDTCALCNHYETNELSDADSCMQCPLRKMTGAPCDFDEEAPWRKSKNDPMPMIRALRKAIKLTKEGKLK